MAKPNFSFQKRQKELARQKKQDEKKQRKLEKTTSASEDGQETAHEGPQGEAAPAALEQDQA